MNLFKKSALIAALTLVSAGAFAQTKSPGDALKDIENYRSGAFQDAIKAHNQPDFRAIDEAVKAKAQQAVKDVDPKKVDLKDAFDWAQLYSMAGENKIVCDLMHRYLATKPGPDEKFRAQSLMMQSCNALGEGRMLEGTLADIKPTNASQSSELVNMTVYEYSDTIARTRGTREALKVLDGLSKGLILADPKTEAQSQLEAEKKRIAARNQLVPTDDELLKTLQSRVANQNESLKYTIVEKRAELLGDEGKQKEAIAGLDEYLKGLDANSPIRRGAAMARTRLSLKGEAAPAITFDKSYGEFTNLDALKGKVVIIDTFAHWCGPCKASFPDMRKMYDDLHDKGLEIVGVTTFYGFYGQQRPVDKDTEYAKMADFRKEFNMSWPIVFGERKNFENYGVSGIPTAYLIDRSGKVRSIHVGYSAESFQAFRAEVEKLVASK